MMNKDYSKLQSSINDYFAELSQEELQKDIFPKFPELFNAIAEFREYGITWQYKKATETFKVNEKMIFFESNLGKQYTGNPRYIYERMIERYPDYTYVWCYHGNAEIPGNPIIVKRASEEYYKLLAQSRYIVNNTTFPLWYHRPETFYLQTWHGTPFKRLHWDMTSRQLARRSSPDFYAKSTKWDALLSPNSYSTSKFRSAFRYEGEIIEYGYPANDIFYDKVRYEKTRHLIREKLGINNDEIPVYLYAPTWRDGKHIGNAMFEFDLLFDPYKFLENAPKDAVLLVRSHHMSSSDEELSKLQGRVIDVSGWDDAVELMCASDVLITDYSSIVFDWYCSRKPVLYYVPDYEQYVGPLRGSYFELKENNAGQVCNTEEELFQLLPEVANVKTTSYGKFYADFCSAHDGNSSDRVIDYLLSR
jgi:CDP-glycerol glycerophosphotransferase (TagB/SpsB family)